MNKTRNRHEKSCDDKKRTGSITLTGSHPVQILLDIYMLNKLNLKRCINIFTGRHNNSAGVKTTKGQDYKEKHKLDSKQISNSPC